MTAARNLCGGLPPGVVQVHLRDLSLLEETDAVLSLSERRRAAEFLNTVARERFVKSRTVLRCLLGEHLGLRPDDVPIRLDAWGKPQLGPPFSEINFNLAHAEHLCLFALVCGHAVGADLEQVRERPGLNGVSARLFGPEEHKALMETPAGDFNAAFYRTWTRREAVIKALGLGLGVAPDEVSVPVSAASRPWSLKAGGVLQTSWLTSDLEGVPGFCAALAVPGGAGLSVSVVSSSYVALTATPVSRK